MNMKSFYITVEQDLSLIAAYIVKSFFQNNNRLNRLKFAQSERILLISFRLLKFSNYFIYVPKCKSKGYVLRLMYFDV